MRSWSPFVVLALVLAASSALAEGVPAASPPPPPPPGGYPPPPPPPPGYYVPPPGVYAYVPPPPNPSIHNHDGFYLCLALGGGYVSDSESASISGFSSQDYKITGGGVIGEIKLGGTPGRGLVVGGGVEFGAFPSPSVKAGNGVSSTGTSQTLNVSTIGPFVDYYFDPSQGLHLQALIGYGVLSVSSKDGSSSSSSGGNPSGLALSLGFGDEWWVGEQWSIGVLARLQYVNAKRSETILGTTISDSNSVVVPGLLATFTNH